MAASSVDNISFKSVVDSLDQGAIDFVANEISSLLDSYQNKATDVDLSSWLSNEFFTRIPNITVEEAQNLAQETLDAFASFKKKKDELNEKLDQGVSIESWLKNEILNSIQLLTEEDKIHYLMREHFSLSQSTAEKVSILKYFVDNGLINPDGTLVKDVPYAEKINDLLTSLDIKLSKDYNWQDFNSDYLAYDVAQDTLNASTSSILFNTLASSIANEYNKIDHPIISQAQKLHQTLDNLQNLFEDEVGDNQKTSIDKIDEVISIAKDVNELINQNNNGIIIENYNETLDKLNDIIDITTKIKSLFSDEQQPNRKNDSPIDIYKDVRSKLDTAVQIADKVTEAIQYIPLLSEGSKNHVASTIMKNTAFIKEYLGKADDLILKVSSTCAIKIGLETGSIKAVIPPATPVFDVASQVEVAIDSLSNFKKVVDGEMSLTDALHETRKTIISTVIVNQATAIGSTMGTTVGVMLGAFLGPVGASVGGVVGGALGAITGGTVGKYVAKGVSTLYDGARSIVSTAGSAISSGLSSLGSFVCSWFS